MKLRLILGACLLSISLAIICFISKLTDLNQSSLADIKHGEFVLVSHSGPWSFKEKAKELNFVYFGFTHCPDVCPMTMAFFGSALKELTPEAKARTNFVFVSVDYERDTPKRALEYAAHFGPEVVALTGTAEQIREVSNRYKFVSLVEKQSQSKDAFSVSHPNRIYVLDQKLELVDVIAPPTSHEEILAIVDKFSKPSAIRFLVSLFD